MLLTIDIGNSNIVFGIFEEDTLRFDEIRIETQKKKSQEHYQIYFAQIQKRAQISSVAISSVVPELDEIFTTCIKQQFNISPLFVSTNLKTNIQNLSQTPSQLGADRLCDIVYAVHSTQGNRIVVDLGTATKFEVLSKENKYLGGAISPGVGNSFNALLSHASKISNISLSKPYKIVGGFNTKEHLDSGFIYGFASLVDGMIDKIIADQKWTDITVYITGGFSEIITPFLTHSVLRNKTLTLEGLRILWELNKNMPTSDRLHQE